MTYFIFFVSLVLGAFSLPRKSAKDFLKFVMLFLLAIIGFRSLRVGVDTTGYVSVFKKMAELNLSDFGVFLEDAKEPLYYILTWLMGQISSSYVFYLVCWALFPCVALYVTFRDELETPKDYLIAILCLFSLGLFAFFVAGIRQTAAISLVLIGYRYLKNIPISFRIKSYFKFDVLKFALCLYLAYYIHNSSLLFLIAIPCLGIKIRWWYLPGVLALFTVGSYVQIGFLVDMAALFFDDRFASYGTVYESSQNINAFLMQFVLFLVCYFQREKLIEKDKSNIYIFNIVLFGLIFQSFSGMLYEMARVSFYFSIFLLILVPRAFKEYSVGLRSKMYSGFTFALLIYLFFLSSANLPPYSSSIL